MALLAGLMRQGLMPSPSGQLNFGCSPLYLLLHLGYRTRWLSGGTESNRTEFAAENAYDILGVSETSSFTEIKASFRRLAKETHPDLAESKNDPSSSKRFVQILAAYEILSDSKKRAHYDRYLLFRRMVVTKHSRQGSMLYRYESGMTVGKEMEVVEWLKWYREVINDIVTEKRVAAGTGYFDVLEADFYSAIRAAYFGPDIDSMELLPDRFEAEERSVYDTSEVLHLVSGRDLFGMVCLVDKYLELSSACYKKLASSPCRHLGMDQPVEKADCDMKSDEIIGTRVSQIQASRNKTHVLDAYKDIELHISGKFVAMAIRFPPKGYFQGKQNEDDQDRIHVFLNSNGGPNHAIGWCSNDSSPRIANGSRILLGTISGLGTSPDEGSCFVYDGNGAKTHVIMKHRTFLVRHLHWYRIADSVSICECRCSRARLPPSKFWLFEPRCGMHDIGGWYIETFGKDKKGRTVLSQRFWDGFDVSEKFDGKGIRKWAFWRKKTISVFWVLGKVRMQLSGIRAFFCSSRDRTHDWDKTEIAADLSSTNCDQTRIASVVISAKMPSEANQVICQKKQTELYINQDDKTLGYCLCYLQSFLFSHSCKGKNVAVNQRLHVVVVTELPWLLDSSPTLVKLPVSSDTYGMISGAFVFSGPANDVWMKLLRQRLNLEIVL